jgi:hypothetical protein
MSAPTIARGSLPKKNKFGHPRSVSVSGCVDPCAYRFGDELRSVATLLLMPKIKGLFRDPNFPRRIYTRHHLTDKNLSLLQLC